MYVTDKQSNNMVTHFYAILGFSG